MSEYELRCRTCSWTTSPAGPPGVCPECGSRLEVSLAELPDEIPSDSSRYALRRYDDFLPGDGIVNSNGEGWTPLMEAPTLASLEGGTDTTVLVKNETVNPTWSWKDRMAAVVLPQVAGENARVATASTGNHGSAVAAWAAQLDADRTLVFVNPSSEPPHHAQIRAYGAETVELTDEDEAERLLNELADEGWTVIYDLDERFTGQPYIYEGYKTIAFELVEQHGVPDAVVAGVGAGDGLYGVWKGFRELQEAGIIDETPRMVSAESEERHPLARAFEAESESVGADPGPEPLSTSTKSSTTGDHALAAVRNSGGRPTVIDHEALERAIRASGEDGIFLEAASALAAAGVAELAADEEFETVVAVGSGAGVAWPEKATAVLGSHQTVEPSLSAIEDAVGFSLR
jgi:threonine synthase